MKKTALTIILTLLAVFSTFASPKIVVQDKHSRGIGYLKFSSDGKYLFSTDRTQIKIWEYESGMLLKTIIKEKDSPADFSPDGMSCVYVDENRNLKFHSIKTDKNILLKTCEDHIPRDIKIAPNGKFFIIINTFDISMYDTQNLKKTSLINTYNTSSGTFYLSTCAFFPNSSLLAVSAENSVSKEYNILSLTFRRKQIPAFITKNLKKGYNILKFQKTENTLLLQIMKVMPF